MRARRVDPDMSKMQLLDVRKFQVIEAARILRMPPHKLGDHDKLNFCLPASEEVFTECGPKSVADIHPGEMVWSFDGTRMVKARVKHSVCSGEDKILKIKTENRTIRANSAHRILARRKYQARRPGKGGHKVVEWRSEYVPAGELRRGDTLVTLAALPESEEVTVVEGRTLTKGFMEFCGLLLGDGNVNENSVVIARAQTANYMGHYREVIQEEFHAGGRLPNSGERQGGSILTRKQVEEIRALRLRIVTISDIARQFGANICTVTNVANGHVYHPEHQQATITEEGLGAIKELLSSRLTTKEVADQYGVSRATVQKILSGKLWQSTKETKRRVPLLQEDDRCTRFSSAAAAQELKSLGFSGTSHTKSVPGWVFKTSRDMRLAMLRGYLDADGSTDKKGRLSFTSVNFKMLSQFRHLCMSVGVPVTNLRTAAARSTLPGGKEFRGVYHTFTCSDPGANREIGSHDKRYQERMASGQPFCKKNRTYGWFGGRGFDSENASLARIVSVEKEPAEKVYDLEVEGTHSFIANGVVVHNSNVTENNIDYIQMSLNGYRRRWREAHHRHLLTRDEQLQGRLYAEHSIEALLRGSFEKQSQGWAMMLEKGVYNRNEIRRFLNLNPIPGGDKHFVQMNMQELTEVVGEVVKEMKLLKAAS